jgi:PAS domain S-box-containing protein
MLLTSSVPGILVLVMLDRSGILFRGFEKSIIPHNLVSQISDVNTGVISPLTMIVLFTAALSFLWFLISDGRRSNALVFVVGLLTAYTGLVDIAGYIINNKILSGIVSFPSGIALFLIGNALIVSSDTQSFPARLLLGDKMSAVILRKMIPLVITIIFTLSIILILPDRLQFDPVYFVGMGILIFVAMALVLSAGMSSSTGRVIDRLIAEKNVVWGKYINSERKYETLVESLQEGIVILTHEGTIVYTNKRTAEIFNRNDSDLTNHNFFDFIITENENEHNDFRQMTGLYNIVQNDYRIKYDESAQYVSITFVPISRDSGTGGEIIAGIVDITAKKKAEKNLKESLKNREILLQELYHRTKNNMQVICSFIRLSCKNIQSEENQRIFQDLESRIIAMSLVHEKLCKSEDLSKVNILEYTSDLVTLLSSGMASGKIDSQIDMPNIRLPIDIAMPYGLIMAELITNSCKHAFRGSNRGKIRIRISQKDEAIINCEYSDDGLGFDQHSNPDNNASMGLQLIENIVTGQLKGGLTTTYTDGFRAIFYFRTDLYPDRF